MATAAEQQMMVLAVVTEAARQVSKAAALATYAASGFAPGSLAAFRSALISADDSYYFTLQANAQGFGVFAGPVLNQPFGGTNAFMGNTPGIQGGQ